jgi:uncharacterized protein
MTMPSDETCPGCGKPAECGIALGEPTCWCFPLPAVRPMPEDCSKARCYCRACLEPLIRQRTADRARDDDQDHTRHRR